ALNTTGLFVDGSTGVPSRYLPPDRGEPIEYIVDVATLPAGMTQGQAMAALTNSLNAWSAVTSLQFKFIGFETFTQASPTITIKDGRLRIQLHDSFNYISNPSTLGIGGRNYAVSSAFPNGGMGGRVNAQEFYPNNFGYVVMNHRPTSMQNVKTYEEVLCHELGHSLGLAHSSENPGEPNAVLKQAMMYFQVHADNRGATLGSYDPPIVQKVHPQGNTPPYGYSRVMDIVTASPQPNVAGVNSVGATGYDLQGDSLTTSLVSSSANNGSFALVGGLLKYTANFPVDAPNRFDPAGSQAWESAFLRFNDGVHASPYVTVRVLSYHLDTRPAGASDGIPDGWAQTNFGSITPSSAAKTRAQDDYDGDGLTNLEEWLAGTGPATSNSRLQISTFDGSTLNFAARPYEVYEVVGSTDFSTWTRSGTPVLPLTTTGTRDGLGASTGHKFFQVRRVP
ncbi:MAG TPA: hypothetical protein DCY13_06935, partial [Verrucomicrobiales bacterium]|nr:hypothetical protein [Verrucomicrobiales bacterium]